MQLILYIFHSVKAIFKAKKWFVKTDNKTPEQLIYRKQFIFLEIILASKTHKLHQKVFKYINSIFVLRTCKTSEINLTNYDEDDDDELFLWYGWPTKGV